MRRANEGKLEAVEVALLMKKRLDLSEEVVRKYQLLNASSSGGACKWSNKLHMVSIAPPLHFDMSAVSDDDDDDA